MKEIIRTGYNRKQFNSLFKKREPGGCYLCSRNKEGVNVKTECGEPDTEQVELEINMFSVIEDDAEIKYPLCHQCYEFLTGFVRKMIFDNEFGWQFGDSKSKNED